LEKRIKTVASPPWGRRCKSEQGDAAAVKSRSLLAAMTNGRWRKTIVSTIQSSLAFDEQLQTDEHHEWNVVVNLRHAHDKIARLSDHTVEEAVKVTGSITVSF